MLWGIEIKSSPIVKSGSLRGLKSFMEDHPHANRSAFPRVIPHTWQEILLYSLERAVRIRLPGPCFIKTENKDGEDRRGDELVKNDDQFSLCL
jgi:hypothetical protein